MHITRTLYPLFPALWALRSCIMACRYAFPSLLSGQHTPIHRVIRNKVFPRSRSHPDGILSPLGGGHGAMGTTFAPTLKAPHLHQNLGHHICTNTWGTTFAPTLGAPHLHQNLGHHICTKQLLRSDSPLHPPGRLSLHQLDGALASVLQAFK